jgi:hypothetical protein
MVNRSIFGNNVIASVGSSYQVIAFDGTAIDWCSFFCLRRRICVENSWEQRELFDTCGMEGRVDRAGSVFSEIMDPSNKSTRVPISYKAGSLQAPTWLMIGCQQLVHMNSPPCSLSLSNFILYPAMYIRRSTGLDLSSILFIAPFLYLTGSGTMRNSASIRYAEL